MKVSHHTSGRKMALLLAAAVLALLGLAASPSLAEPKPRGHAALGCRQCHSLHNPKGKHLWAAQPPARTEKGTQLLAGEALCYACHKEDGRSHFFEPGSSHPINVAPSPRVQVPPELGTTFVEGLGRVITCTSCHTPHGSSPKLLKITDVQDRLCLACHRFN